jgi:hypothetical protein
MPDLLCRGRKYWLDLEKKKAACGVDGYFENREEYAAKWSDQVARIAALLHIFDESTGQISLETVKRAEEIGNWLAYEFIEAFSESDPIQKMPKSSIFGLKGNQKAELYLHLNSILQFGPYAVRKMTEMLPCNVWHRKTSSALSAMAT